MYFKYICIYFISIYTLIVSISFKYLLIPQLSDLQHL